MTRNRGFTLVEVLVALLILGVMTALGYGTYRQARISAERTADSQQRTREIEFGMRILAQDLAQTAPRPIRQPLGTGRLPALRAGSGAATLLDVTRLGWSNTAGAQRGTLQRVSYRLDKDTLKRAYLPVLDPTLNVQPIERDLLTQVKSVKFRFLDANRTWFDAWPAPGLNPDQAQFARPAAVEILVEFKDWGTVRRLIEVAG
ncbi:MAG: type II secretion system minor pseudopilin GspJ [Proteobacteria bacterium]|nr:type II secretion system minor pseudopilin GspJ [Pseudomonadota bacterium]